MLAVLVLSSIAIAAPVQGSSQGRPATTGSARTTLQAIDYVDTIEMPAIDLDAVFAEDVQRAEQGLPPRFAVPNLRRLTPAERGTWENLDPQTLLWRLRIRSPGALSLNLGFEHFHLPPGAGLYLYSADRGHVVRPFTAEDNEPHDQLWTPVVLSDDLLVELVVPASGLDELRLELTWINQGYRGFGVTRVPLSSGSCNVDVVCPEGIPWQLEIPSVGLISTGGTTFCTGFLVNDVRQDLKPYFMTANHCGIHANNAASLVVYWNYQNSTCRPPGGGASGGPGNGSLAHFNTGSLFRAGNTASDFTLVELDDPVDPAFGLSYAGWDRSGADASSAVVIHHPNTAEKRISFENDPTSTTTYLEDVVPGDGTHERVADWDLGSTEVGSSGAPLFDEAHHVIGQLHGGTAACTSQTSDWFGKFALSWTGGGTSSTRLRDWLDPDNTGVQTLDTASLATVCSSAGTITLHKAHYGCSDSALVEVVDCDLNTDSGVAETVAVQVSSSSETAGETLVLSETAVSSGHFRATIPLSDSDSSGVVLVAPGDTLSARYVDASDGAGGTNLQRTASAPIDCTPPVVLSVSFSNVASTSARLTVGADEPIVITAIYGTSCALSGGSASSEDLATNAVVDLTGLLPDQTYYVKVLAVDEAGNGTLDTNGGACHVFTTADVPDFLTEQFTTDNDLDSLSLQFVPSAGQNGYTLCTRHAGELPTDPASGTQLPLTDDSSLLVSLSGGKAVQLFGVAYPHVYVNSNGNLTFNAANTDRSETLAEHFSVPRIAVLWDDLNPASHGRVVYQQLGDRLAVTWLNVPEFGTMNRNTCQAELFFDGRIRLTYLGVAVTDGITGLSRATGLSPQFVETDLSAAPACASVPVQGASRPGQSVEVVH